MPKIIYLAERKPGLGDEAFVARWRRHGALAMSMSLWASSERYIQASVVRPAPAPGASDAYDAVGVLWTDERSHLNGASPQHQEDVAKLLADELETFSGPIAPVCMAVEETVLKRGEAALTAYAFFKDASAARRFAEEAAAQPAPKRVALNVKAGVGEHLRLPYQAIVEVSVQGPAAFDGLDLGAAQVAVVARDVVLWPKPQ